MKPKVELITVLDKATVRRCIATGEVMSKEKLLRFVVSPEGILIADLDRDLPGRGIWVSRQRKQIERAVKKRLFLRASKASVTVAEDLPEHVDKIMRRRCLGLLGLARRAGKLTLGFEKVKLLLADDPTAIFITAQDASRNGRNKLLGCSSAGWQEKKNPRRVVLDVFDVEELSLALGRENVVHAALCAGGLADRFASECRQLLDYRG